VNLSRNQAKQLWSQSLAEFGQSSLLIPSLGAKFADFRQNSKHFAVAENFPL